MNKKWTTAVYIILADDQGAHIDNQGTCLEINV